MHAMETAVRDARKVHADLIDQDMVSLTKGGCYIYIPVDFTSKEMAYISSTVDIIGMFAITTDRKTFGVSNVTTMMEITPTAFEVVDIFGEPHYEFRFDPGTVVFPQRMIQCVPGHVYNIASHIYDFGNVPFWMNAVDHAELLSNVELWNTFRVFNDQITHDIYSAHVQRSPKDVRAFFSSTLKKDSDQFSQVQFIPLRDGSLNKTSRLSKLADTNLKRGIRSALSNDPVRAEPLEDLFMR